VFGLIFAAVYILPMRLLPVFAMKNAHHTRGRYPDQLAEYFILPLFIVFIIK